LLTIGKGELGLIIPKKKACNLCGKVVAEKNTILYHTIEPYITMRFDEPVTYGNYEDNTTKFSIHVCLDCWNEIKKSIKK